MARYSMHAASAPPTERVLLSLKDWRDPEERATIKRLGAQWDGVLREWWISYRDLADNPGIYRWIKCPIMANKVKEAYDFVNYGSNPPKQGNRPSGKKPKEARKRSQKPKTQR